jgi:hypothetical protein
MWEHHTFDSNIFGCYVSYYKIAQYYAFVRLYSGLTNSGPEYQTKQQ